MNPFIGNSLIAFALVGGAGYQARDYSVGWSGGKASFISPAGRSLWSFGVDCVDTGTARKDYKPSNKSYAAFNLFTSDEEWVHDTVKKLTDWGFNSTGGWSDDDLFRKYAGRDRLPYFVVLHLGAWNQAPWHDMFDKQMDHWVNLAAQKQIPAFANDPHLVGYFSDNELGWWDDTIFLTYLKFKPEAPGRKRLIESLRSSYQNDFSRLMRDWIVKGTSFESITDLHLRPGGSGRKAINQWTEVIGRRYYSLMRDTIRKYDKGHLILGDRYCQYYTLPIVRASKGLVDVVSTNFGADWNDGSIAPFFLRTLNQVTGRPVIITEFYMCARENRSGNQNSSLAFPVVQTQTERAKSFANYMRSVASLPYVVGAHWFQFSDEPAHGRGDGENFNMGLVDTSGRPYEQMVAASSSLGLAGLRSKAADPPPSSMIRVPWIGGAHAETGSISILPNGRSQKPLGTSLSLASLRGRGEGEGVRPTPKVHYERSEPSEGLAQSLKGWPMKQGVLPVTNGTPFGDMFVARDTDNLYIALYAMDYMDESLYLGGHIPQIDRNRWRISFGWQVGQIDVRYGGKGQNASVNIPGIEVSQVPGLKYTVILKVPLRLFTRTDKTRIDATLDTHGRSSQMKWGADCDLREIQ